MASAVAPAVQIEPATDVPAVDATTWSLPTKVAFRVGFLYLMQYMFLNGNVTIFTPLLVFPKTSSWIHDKLFWPMSALTQWWAVKLLHLTGMAATWHSDGSGDTLLNYLLCVTFLGIALVGGLVWSVLDRRRANYTNLYAWLRFLLRINVGMGMLQYGFYKVWPVQMQPPNLAVLNEPLGQTSPMMLLWTLLGLYPWYERVCGAAEVLGGVLILFRRTALTGALLSAFVMTNVVLYNFFFDVPVKLYALHLLAMASLAMLPDLGPLWDFFVMRRSARLEGVWVPPATARTGRIAIVATEWIVLVGSVWGLSAYDAGRYHAYLASVRPSPLIGLWELEPGTPLPSMFGGAQWHSISIDSLSRGMARSADGQLWRMYLTEDDAKHILTMNSRGGSDVTKYSWRAPDADHLVLVEQGGSRLTLVFNRVPTPKQYPLLTRGFHLVSEWGYQR